MYERYRKELRKQGLLINDLAEYSGVSANAWSKKLSGTNPIRLRKAYSALDFLHLPHEDLPVYFPDERRHA